MLDSGIQKMSSAAQISCYIRVLIPLWMGFLYNREDSYWVGFKSRRHEMLSFSVFMCWISCEHHVFDHEFIAMLRQADHCDQQALYSLMGNRNEVRQTKKQRSATTEKSFVFCFSEDFTVLTQNLSVAPYITLENLFSSCLAIFISFTLFPRY